MVPASQLELRDWFAGQALIGILMNPDTPRPEAPPLDVHTSSIAEQAYAYADAMIRQRSAPRAAGAPPGA